MGSEHPYKPSLISDLVEEKGQLRLPFFIAPNKYKDNKEGNMQRGKLYFSVAEENIIEELVKSFEITEFEAVQYLINQKRDLARIHKARGNVALAAQILKEIGED